MKTSTMKATAMALSTDAGTAPPMDAASAFHLKWQHPIRSQATIVPKRVREKRIRKREKTKHDCTCADLAILAHVVVGK